MKRTSMHSTEKRVCAEVGAALGKLASLLDGDKVCVVVGVALGKLVDALDGDTVCVHHDK